MVPVAASHRCHQNVPPCKLGAGFVVLSQARRGIVRDLA